MYINKKAEANSKKTKWQEIKIGDFQNCPLTTLFIQPMDNDLVKITDDGVTMAFVRARRLKEAGKEIGMIDVGRIQMIIDPFGMFLCYEGVGKPDEIYTHCVKKDLYTAVTFFRQGLDKLWDIDWRLNKDPLNQEKK